MKATAAPSARVIAMRILYVAMKYDFGRPERGHSFEHYNFYHSLVNLGHDILYFDFMSLMQQRGREEMNRRLREVVQSEKPDLLFCVLFEEELARRTLKQISRGGQTVTLNWFSDDQQRFEDYSRFWAPCFNWIVTTAQSAVAKYRKIGYANAIKSQWACNHFRYRKLDLPLVHDVSFVGFPHGNRRGVIGALRAAGLNVQAWGQGWEAGRLSQDAMIAVFNQSRINLCLNNDRTPIPSFGKRLQRLVRRSAHNVLSCVPFGTRIEGAGLKVLGGLRRLAPAGGGAARKYIEQIKGRNFEVPGCGGFLLSGQAENIGDFYEDGKEIVCHGDEADLIAKVRYYLEHEEERAAIALAGYQRTLREHTYVHRFAEIFARMGLPAPDLDAALAGKLQPGATLEIT